MADQQPIADAGARGPLEREDLDGDELGAEDGAQVDDGAPRGQRDEDVRVAGDATYVYALTPHKLQ